MGWLQKIIEGLKGGPAYDLTFVPSIQTKEAGIEGIGQAVEADSCFIELYLESLRLSRDRKFATRFHAIVYSFVTLSREDQKRAQLAAISKPERLAELDKDSIDHVITISKQMMGATPFRGGPVSIELGLFSVKSGNILTPLLDYVTRISSTAGISFVGAIKPFLPLITEGMDLIAGQQQDTALEVGVEIDLSLKSGCVMAIIDRPKGSINIDKLSLDKDRRLLLDSKILECGYAVFSLRPTTVKSDFGEIPELKERYAAFVSAISKGKINDAKDSLTAFRLATIASPDLIDQDRDKLIAKAEQKYKKAFPNDRAATSRTKGAHKESLSEIGLYE